MCLTSFQVQAKRIVHIVFWCYVVIVSSMCSPIWLCQKRCTEKILNYASPDVGARGHTELTLNLVVHIFWCANKQHQCPAERSPTIATEHSFQKMGRRQLSQRKGNEHLHVPLSSCQRHVAIILPISSWSSPCVLEAILGGPTLPSHVSRAS